MLHVSFDLARDASVAPVAVRSLLPGWRELVLSPEAQSGPGTLAPCCRSTATAVGLGGLGTSSRGLGEERRVVVMAKTRADRALVSPAGAQLALSWRQVGRMLADGAAFGAPRVEPQPQLPLPSCVGFQPRLLLPPTLRPPSVPPPAARTG